LHELKLPYLTPWTWGADQILSAAGDVDLDGHADYAVLVTKPPRDRGSAELRTISGASGTTIDVSQKGETFTAVVSVGDLDGDHVPELALGRTRHAQPVVLWSTARKQALRSFEPEGAADSYALALDAGKDIDGDGTPDLVYSLVSDPPRGSRIFAWSLKDGQPLWTAKGPPGTLNFGALVVIVGDLDGDGKREVLVGAPGMRDADSSAVVLRGVDGSVLRRHDFGVWQASGFGVSGCTVADLDGDGIEDYLIGESCPECGRLAPSCVRAYSGKSGVLLAEWYAEDMRAAPR
jgi:hypothetical protein